MHHTKCNLCTLQENCIMQSSGMTLPNRRRRPVPCTPRPWLTRMEGECAFPVDGDGWTLRACCNQSGAGTYCRAHAARMKGPPAPPIDVLEREIAALLEF